ncbi:hypothetical protein [Streptomyces sp. NPDC127092]
MGEQKTRLCRHCHRRLDERRRGRPKRFCSRWHRVRYWLDELGDLVFG